MRLYIGDAVSTNPNAENLDRTNMESGSPVPGIATLRRLSTKSSL